MPAYEDVILGLAKRIQLLRKNLGMTQAALANRAGVTVETVARLERVVRARVSANSNPSLETLTRIANALEVDLHELLTPEPVVPRKNDQLSYLLANASPVLMQRLLRVAEALFREDQELTRHSGVFAVAQKSQASSESR
ncbi:MAG TPA: helix-turn-helix transcriptional regulator [Polyangiaceae bacterium]|nr:helix-turn-helix transcriptional regulator [Polyangiaceae bacterium]